MYGSDAANGVIVITTKHGQAGPTHWTLSPELGLSFQPGGYPVGLYRFGHYYNGSTQFCYLIDLRCTLDSVVPFQALNDPRFAVTTGHGDTHTLSGSVSGGVNALVYSITGSVAQYTGQLQLPAIEAERFTKFHGIAPPAWMQHPDRYTTAGATTVLTLPLAVGERHGTVALTTSLFNSDQQQSSLQTAIAALQATYVDTTTLDEHPLIPDYYTRVTTGSRHFLNALSLNWPLISWLPLTATAGVDFMTRTDQNLTPRDYKPERDSIGSFLVQHSTNLVNTVTVSSTIPSRFVRTSVGFNFTGQSRNDLGVTILGLPIGVNSPTRSDGSCGSEIAGCMDVAQNTVGAATYGWYIAPLLNIRSRFFITPGLRLDGGTASGDRVATNVGGVRIPGLNGFPKIDWSWLVLDGSQTENGQNRSSLFRAFDQLRIRGSFGVAGVQPAPADYLRLFSALPIELDGGTQEIVAVNTLGNTTLRPERSREMEGGFEATLFDNRLAFNMSWWVKNRYDAILPVTIAPSVLSVPMTGGTISVDRNIGEVHNSGTDMTIDAQLLERAMVGWHVSAAISHQANRVVKLAPGLAPIEDDINSSGAVSRIIAGYPLNGYWAKPILGYSDLNQDGIIQPTEVLIGDSLQFVGQEFPNYELTINTDLNLFQGRLGVHTTVAYQNGLTQFNQTATGTSQFSSGSSNAGSVFWGNDPSAPLSQQAAYAAFLGSDMYSGGSRGTPYGLIQVVNTLRWQSLSINYVAPASVARLFRARHLEIALQGSNLGLHTNYRGKDPNVNAFSTGERVMDSGQLPMPRTFNLKVSLGN
jgi:hypothetical protein